PASYTVCVDCCWDSVWPCASAQKLEQRPASLAEGRSSRFHSCASSRAKHSGDRSNGLDPGIAGGRGPIVPNDSAVVGCSPWFRHTAHHDLQGRSFAFPYEDGPEHTNCLSAVDRAHSSNSWRAGGRFHRSEEHTSELQSHFNL